MAPLKSTANLLLSVVLATQTATALRPAATRALRMPALGATRMPTVEAAVAKTEYCGCGGLGCEACSGFAAPKPVVVVEAKSYCGCGGVGCEACGGSLFESA
mmetsp:Transcript_14526/g.43375  ORF Transcript_14526/g.43375 Transcript_14526/m.43375 type:complete len:102 (+) Transcript_14526:128-433(+)|eukprot:CAMPEP_0119268806 /NCGR_PEP_ID=MMETSP1329-20130426/6461_1 /TAXON_ID=114041 /ORGANISM="Genus nov. species nov., Strain RCC1024" /LENGTH=101 /DNA_ID=CAMNT_0007268789 /DNA_START=118 /DNA_END=423 /DNA_ORIENTATION=+